MRRFFRDINVPTFIAVIVFIAFDKKFNMSGRLLSMVGMA